MDAADMIKLLRIKKNISQKEFAKKAGITHNYLSQIENGKRKPGNEFYIKAAEILDLPVHLLTWEKVDLTKFKDKESKVLAKKIQTNFDEIKRIIFGKLAEN